MRYILSSLFAIFLATPTVAEEFSNVEQRASFVSLVDGKQLTRLGIKLDVKPDGRIVGRAFGRNVSGAWKWQAGFFCRDLNWGSEALGQNCQRVKVQGDTIRFISDKGAGESADLRLR